MQFFQFYVWGAWMPCFATWWFATKHWEGTNFGLVFSTMGISSIFLPTIAGIIADRWINAEKLFGMFHICGGVLLFLIPLCPSPIMVFGVMLFAMFFYMPTISLSITISYASMEEAGMNIVREYPPIRVWGTVGFIAGMWTISLLHLENAPSIFIISGISALLLGIYGFFMPNCPSFGKGIKNSWTATLGLNAFKLFKDYRMALFFIFSMLIYAVLELSLAYSDVFLHSFDNIIQYNNCFVVKYPAIVLSVSQMSETFMILLVPFVLRKFGIKIVMIMSIFAWVLRFGLYAFGNPENGLWMILLSMIVYGAGFDFFNISGSLYTELKSHSSIRASAQGLFMLMTNGAGAVIGSLMSGWLISAYYTNADKSIHWQGWDGLWICFAICALCVGIAFCIMFKHKHNSAEMTSIGHH